MTLCNVAYCYVLCMLDEIYPVLGGDDGVLRQINLLMEV